MKPHAIIVDLDGTLSDSRPRADYAVKHYWDEFYGRIGEDEPNRWCVEIVKMAHTAGYKVFFLTGRPEKYSAITLFWIQEKSGVPADLDFELLMRPNNSKGQQDAAIKETLYREHIAPRYDVIFAIDDRERVIQMWRKNGLVALQCGEGKF